MLIVRKLSLNVENKRVVPTKKKQIEPVCFNPLKFEIKTFDPTVPCKENNVSCQQLSTMVPNRYNCSKLSNSFFIIHEQKR